MAATKLGETAVHTCGELPNTGSHAPAFSLVNSDLKDVLFEDFKGKNIVLNIFPSIDTRVCAMSVREFNRIAARISNTQVLCVSKDLPFALNRFCGAEGLANVISLSGYRSMDFGTAYGVELIDGAFKGLYARAVVVINSAGIVTHSELVPSISQEPDYDMAIAAVNRSYS